jgi:uncharacterized protein YdcH (DUF465 family)
MSEGSHNLVAEFPKYKDRIHELKVANAHFRKLFDEYHDVTRTISRAEQRVEILSELEEEKMRKRRLALKDELYGILSNNEGN